MYGTGFVLVLLLLGLVSAQQPSVDIVRNSTSFLCNERYLVVDIDYITVEVDFSGNDSVYGYYSHKPRIYNAVLDGNGQIQSLIHDDIQSELKDGILRMTSKRAVPVMVNRPAPGDSYRARNLRVSIPREKIVGRDEERWIRKCCGAQGTG
ncbi:hypothetical protein PoB_001560300 [Plakobranchus ocellatus]|uniref:Uncharacterized protein n=1 Tax=Plakobranchus ocellatus TaxID=259542 RepID=A0AAV3Z3C6_9GAST|nr:hypothetical protein PoB_001560300 [Plakobranchus ocellatus]